MLHGQRWPPRACAAPMSHDSGLGAPQSWQNLPSERATGRFEHGRAANMSRGARGYSENLWEETLLGETAPGWAGRPLAAGGQQGGMGRERHPNCQDQEIILSMNILNLSRCPGLSVGIRRWNTLWQCIMKEETAIHYSHGIGCGTTSSDAQAQSCGHSFVLNGHV